MQVHHLSCGTLSPIGSVMMTASGNSHDSGKLVCHCLLIETPNGLIMVDTGLGLQDMDHPAERIGRVPSTLFRIEQDMNQTALHQVKVLGFDPSDVTDIVMTHLDFDQAGGLADFPRAKVHVLDLEHEVAVNPHSLIERNRYSQAQFAHGPNWVTHVVGQGEKWFGFEKVRPMLDREPEILLIPLFGHSRGHCGVAIKEENGWLLHCGDAIYHGDQLDPVSPSAPVGIQLIEHLIKDNIEAVEANQGLLRQLYHESREQIQFICTHDPAMFDRYATPYAAEPAVAYAG